jgi:hypothetical protein
MSNTGVAQIVAEGGGAGAADNRLEFVTGGATRMTVAADGVVALGQTTITSSTYPPLDMRRTTASGNAKVASSRLTAVSSVNVTSGFATQFAFGFSDTGVNNQLMGTMGFQRMAADNTSDFFIENMDGGSQTERFRVKANGDVTAQGTTASTSTTTGALVVSGGVGIAGSINAGGTIQTGGYAFADLPTSPTTGMRAYITDGASSPVYMDIAAGGGSTVTPVFYDGTNWINA